MKTEENQKVTVIKSIFKPHNEFDYPFTIVCMKSVGTPRWTLVPMSQIHSFLRPVTPRHPWPQVGLLRSRPDLFPGYSVPDSFRFRFMTPGHVGRDIDVRLWEPMDRLSRPGFRTAICDLRKRARKLLLSQSAVTIDYFEPTVGSFICCFFIF